MKIQYVYRIVWAVHIQCGYRIGCVVQSHCRYRIEWAVQIQCAYKIEWSVQIHFASRIEWAVQIHCAYRKEWAVQVVHVGKHCFGVLLSVILHSYMDNLLSTFRHRISVPSSRLKMSMNIDDG